MLVTEIMEVPEEILRLSEQLTEIGARFTRTDDEELPVVNHDGQLIGVVTRKGLLSAITEKTNSITKVEEILEKPCQIIQSNADLKEINWYAEKKTIWIVNNKNILVGVLRLNKLGEINTEGMRVPFSHSKNSDPLHVLPVGDDRLFISILESSFDGIWIANNKGDTLYVNSAYERITGLRREQLVGKNMGDLLKEKLFEHSTVLAVLDKKTPVSIIHKYVTGRIALATGNPVFNETGDIIMVVCNVRDISELVKLRNELGTAKNLSNKYSHELLQLRQQQMENSGVISTSKGMKRVLDLALKTAPFDNTVLIQGDSGTGKEVMAKFIHQQSPRKNAPFIKVNCAAIPGTLVESELFGYTKGSFTGANNQGKPGMFELANGGTILLDEIGEIPLDVQAKLLRVIQEKEVFPIGAKEPVKLDVRILASTNKNLSELVQKGSFREDLFYRLNVVPINILPLKERKEDIPAFIYYFLEKHNKRYKQHKTFPADVIDILKNYSWPGNVRELENLIEYLFIVSTEDEISLEHLPPKLLTEGLSLDDVNAPGQLQSILDYVEKQVIDSSIKNHGSIRKAAAVLGVNPSTLVRKLQKYRIKTDA